MLRDTPQGTGTLKKGESASDIAWRWRAARIECARLQPESSSIPISLCRCRLPASATWISTFSARAPRSTHSLAARTVSLLFPYRLSEAPAGSLPAGGSRSPRLTTIVHSSTDASGTRKTSSSVRRRSLSGSLRPLSSRVSLRFGYDLDYTHLAASDATAASFVVPADQVVHGARISLDVQRAGWNASAWWNPARRIRMARVGPGRLWRLPADRMMTFSGTELSISRSHVINPRAVARFEGAWMDGQDLDRFSRYSFGTFDNRLRGYPSALIRYDRGAVLRTAVGYGISRLMRVDGFFDSAAVHDPGFGEGLSNYTGMGGRASKCRRHSGRCWPWSGATVSAASTRTERLARR